MNALAVEPVVPAVSKSNNRHGISSVLVVDDDPLLLGILESYCKKIGVVETTTAEDGAAALAAVDADNASFDLACCDLNMPNLDGIAFLSRLSERGFDGGVIIISSEHDAIRKTAEDFAGEAGLNILGSLRKPFDPRQFDTLIASRKSRRKHTARPAAPDYTPDQLFAEDGGIVPFFQPQVCARTGVVRGAESLARLRLDDDSMVSPFHFFDTIEKHNLWFRLFERMLDKSVAELAEWLRAGHDFTLSVNIDAYTLCEPSLADRVRATVSTAAIEPSRLTLELTEDAALTSTARMLETIARLRLFGFQVSTDDFGKGYSNFERIQRMPFTELKLDRQFVVAAATDAIAAACVTSSVALARAGGFNTVAEGVETQRQLDYVRAAGIDTIQGFLVSEPLSANAFRRFAKASVAAPLI